jgi:hypothetical protein
MNNRVALLVILSVLAVVAILYLLRPRLRLSNNVDWNRPPALIFNNASWIAHSLGRYQSVHNGHLPSHISELVPTYISYNNIQLFFWPKKDWGITNYVPEVISKEIDGDGIFVYLGEAGFRDNLVMYERTNLWSELQNAIIVDTNLEAMTIPGTEVRYRLSRLHR